MSNWNNKYESQLLTNEQPLSDHPEISEKLFKKYNLDFSKMRVYDDSTDDGTIYYLYIDNKPYRYDFLLTEEWYKGWD